MSLFALGSEPAARAGDAGPDIGQRLLQAQLPAGASLRRLTCRQLTVAVHNAILARRDHAIVIFTSALTLNEWDERRREEYRLSCVCVARLYHAAATAVPVEAPALLETAEALYPDCADALLAVYRGLEAGARVASVSQTSGGDGDPGAFGTGPNFGSSLGASADAGGDPDGPSGFAGGVGPGFPGAPGFGGSSPGGGGITLPSPIGVAVTASANE